MTEYNQAFKDALMFMSKRIYLGTQTKSIQSDIINLCHWLDENPKVSREKLLNQCAEILRKYIKPKEVRY